MNYDEWIAKKAMMKEMLEALTKSASGCSDGYCRVLGPSTGMHTNGGCRCYRFTKELAEQVGLLAEELRIVPWKNAKDE